MAIFTPRSVLTRPGGTTGYSKDDLIASSTTAGSIVVPYVDVPGTGLVLRRIRIHTNLTTGGGAIQFMVEFWKAPPTFTNGDNGAYAVATGAEHWLGVVTTTVSTQAGDGTYCAGVPTTGSEIGIVLGAGRLYWTLKEADSTGFTPIANQTFTLVAELHSHI